MIIERHFSTRTDNDGASATITITLTTSATGSTIDDIARHLTGPLRTVVDEVTETATKRLTAIEGDRETVISAAMQAALESIPGEHRDAVARRLGVA